MIRQISTHLIDRIDERFPFSRDVDTDHLEFTSIHCARERSKGESLHISLTSELTVCSYFFRYPSHLSSEEAKRVDHRVDSELWKRAQVSVNSSKNRREWWLTLRSSISPLTSTSIFLDKSPSATARVTSAIDRTCLFIEF